MCRFFTIAGGSYYFTGNLVHTDPNTDAITLGENTTFGIEASNVTIDMMGYTLYGPGSGTGDGINFTGRENVTIKKRCCS